MLLWIEKILRFLIKCFLFFSISLTFAQTTLLVLPDSGTAPLVQAIKSAKKNIKITMYGFTSNEIAEALIQQRHRGVMIQLLIEKDPYKTQGENKKILQRLKKNGISVRYSPQYYSLTHQKTLLIDEKHGLILTNNFTYSGLHHQRNFILAIDNKNIVHDMNQLFEADWNKKRYQISKNSLLVLSPENTGKKIKTFIKNSHTNLDIYAIALTEKQLVNLLLKQSIPIRILLSPTTKILNQDKLCQHQIQLHTIKNPEQHAKVLISDHSAAYIGSANLSYSGMFTNRELGLITSEKKAIQTLETTFETDWKNSTSICKTTPEINRSAY